MPYTPPSRSPASSAIPSPDVSRRSSFISPSIPSPRPALPRSSSYLSRHRRSASAGSIPTLAAPVAANGPTPDITPPGTSDNLKGMAVAFAAPVRQSPPPVADAKAMPPGAIISPPDSSSEDEGAVESEARGRKMETVELKVLKEAISAMSQPRESSPVRSSLSDIPPSSKSNNPVGESRQTRIASGLPALNTNTRKVSHSRSQTESHIYSMSAEASLSNSEDGSEQDEPSRKPQMVRKKSGELVRPALRPPSRRRPSSMPGTPTFSKAVHFDSHLEHVRHFLQLDRPLAVSAGSSPADHYESDNEYPFPVEEKSSIRSPPFEWELAIGSIPPETPFRRALPVRLERVWMSPDQKSLLGSVAVANLAFHKSVVCRFTFDYWKTTSEVAAEFHQEIRLRETETSQDRFQFSLKLSDFANLEAKTLFFCIRYNVNGVEYWDNNDNTNFQVDFRKKVLPQPGNKNSPTPQNAASARPANGLPRSTRRTNANASTVARPKSMPPGAMDEFGHESKLDGFDRPLHEVLGESGQSGLRLKTSKSSTSLPSDNLPNRVSTPSGQAFANRYDFGASLSAAKQAHRDRESSQRGSALYMKAHKKTSTPPSSEVSPTSTTPSGSSSASTPTPRVIRPMFPRPSSPSAGGIASASYEEILNKYCFFNGSKQSSPQAKDGTLQNGRLDNMEELFHVANEANPGPNGSPNLAERPHHYGAIHHSLRQNLNPYLHTSYVPTTGGSPAEAPMSQQSIGPLNQPSSTATAPTVRTPSPGPMSSFMPLTAIRG